MMQHSESLAALGAALAKVQGELGHAPMNATNPFLKSKYADLGAIIETAKPVLPKHGLSYSQHPCGEGGRVGVETILMHSSGEWLSSRIEMDAADERGKSAAQVAGSIITYLRRYALAAALGIYADEDTDGQAPPKSRPPRPAQPDRPPIHEPNPSPRETGELITPAQMRKLHATLGDLGLHDDRGEALRQIGGIIGRPLESTKDLTRAEASKVIDHLNKLTTGDLDA